MAIHLFERKAGVGALLAACALLFSAQAYATATLKLSSGGDTVEISDNGSLDFDSDSGDVTWLGTVGNFEVEIVIGLTKPKLGTATSPQLHLDSLTVTNADGSGAGGTLEMWFSEIDYQSIGTPLWYNNFGGGGTDGSASFAAYLDDSNTLYGTGTTLASFGAFGGGFGFSDSTQASTSGSYSLTQYASITHGDGTDLSTSFDFFTDVPAPATLLLIGAGLLGLSVVRRRRNG